MRMTWSELLKAPPPLSMTGLLSFMERWKPGSTQGFAPATADQIAALAKPHGGLDALPRVYREFLATMGASTGDLRLTFYGTTSVSALLEDLEDPQRERPDPRRYLKFTIGEDDYEGRDTDDFFELTRPTPNGRDAAIIRIHEEDLVSGKGVVEQPFPTFSDWLRSVIVSRVCLEAGPKQQRRYYDLGPNSEAPAKAYEFFTRLGFSLTELGASSEVIPLEHSERGAIALISAPSTSIPSTGLELYARDKAQQLLLNEVIQDHKHELRGG
ncbi:SMI1/KNR4 family protein [Myxococcus sp. RHSTA-1-4]|uniref:SMI1/KNR4 family protein n=1 Tax=Myxococcus sp. RHSTA-1-4 TaxID=2874601 RepID=UPI001CBBACA1|nr:SMI1/KNR4 family protein [Myxococcus sp. RHSTA-1-4]MBZ4420817.1 SMI1/KNR4 family protein [Myxococcus sp. RHSTA-1-4]